MTAAGRPTFDQSILSSEDFMIAVKVLSGRKLTPFDNAALDWLYSPDAVVTHDDGTPIMYRWHLVPRNDFANVYFHIQVRDDGTGRGPHDHMYDSQSTILAGTYIERAFHIYDSAAGRVLNELQPYTYTKGMVVRRRAPELHMLKLAEGCPYTMTIFATGPRYRAWGFVDPDGTWHPADARGDVVNGVVVAKGRAAT